MTQVPACAAPRFGRPAVLLALALACGTPAGRVAAQSATEAAAPEPPRRSSPLTPTSRVAPALTPSPQPASPLPPAVPRPLAQVQPPVGTSPAVPSTPGLPAVPPVGGGPVVVQDAPQRLFPSQIALQMEVGVGRLVQLPSPAATVMAADPRIARVQPASPTSLFVMAAAPGRTTIIATAQDGTPIIEYDVNVRPGRSAPTEAAQPGPARPGLNAREFEVMLRRGVRGAEGVRAATTRDALILSGVVANAADVQRIMAIAHAYAGENREVVNDLTVLNSITVNVRVRIAEISRELTRELGFNWAALGGSGNWSYGMRINNPLGVASVPGTAITTGASRIGGRFFDGRNDINGIIDALAADQLISILAEPNLTAQSGEVASFLAGGEFPVPVASGNNGAAITIEFKQFGVSLAFVPTVLSAERMNLRIRPEVSELSDRGAIDMPTLTGNLRIPALSVRRAETTVELGSGQSFAIAGLLQQNFSNVSTGPIWFSELPVLGALARSERFRRNETELVIIVTPYLVRPVADPRALAAPTDGIRPATDLDRILMLRQISRGAPARRVPPADAGFIVE